MYKRGSFITGCGCRVIVQAFHSNLLRGWGLNAGMAAMAVRVGDTTFQVTGAGIITVSGDHTDIIQPGSTPRSFGPDTSATVITYLSRPGTWRFSFRVVGRCAY